MTDVVMLIAYVRPTRRAMVARALRALGFTGWTESEVVGHGRAANGHAVPHTRFEVLVGKERATECANTVIDAAYTGEDGDGFVSMLPVLSVERISDRSTGRTSLPEV